MICLNTFSAVQVNLHKCKTFISKGRMQLSLLKARQFDHRRIKTLSAYTNLNSVYFISIAI